jgi:hypothetical protein
MRFLRHTFADMKTAIVEFLITVTKFKNNLSVMFDQHQLRTYQDTKHENWRYLLISNIMATRSEFSLEISLAFSTLRGVGSVVVKALHY